MDTSDLMAYAAELQQYINRHKNTPGLAQGVADRQLELTLLERRLVATMPATDPEIVLPVIEDGQIPPAEVPEFGS